MKNKLKFLDKSKIIANYHEMYTDRIISKRIKEINDILENEYLDDAQELVLCDELEKLAYILRDLKQKNNQFELIIGGKKWLKI